MSVDFHYFGSYATSRWKTLESRGNDWDTTDVKKPKITYNMNGHDSNWFSTSQEVFDISSCNKCLLNIRYDIYFYEGNEEFDDVTLLDCYDIKLKCNDHDFIAIPADDKNAKQYILERDARQKAREDEHKKKYAERENGKKQ